MKEKLKNHLKNLIDNNLEDLPFYATKWSLEIKNNKETFSENVKFGHYETEEFVSYPFYKPFSKIIDFSKIDE